MPYLKQQFLRQVAKRLLPNFVQKLVRRCLYIYRLKMFPQRVTHCQVFGQDLKIWIGDINAERWYDRKIRELPFLELVKPKILTDNSLVFYIGAHYCVYANALAKMLEGKGRVVAIEANPDIYQAAKRNIALNSLNNIKVTNQAISDSEGFVRFTLGCKVSRGEHGIPTIEVPASTIDRVFDNEGVPKLIIVDVEGYECQVLKGGSRLLESSAVWCVEVHVGCGLETYGGSLEDVLRHFPFDRFDLYMARDYGTEMPKRFDLGDVLTRKRFHLIAIPRG